MTQLTLGRTLDDVDLATFYGAKSAEKCTVTITLSSDSTDPVTKSGNCKGVTVKTE